MLSSNWYVTAATYRFRDIRGQIAKKSVSARPKWSSRAAFLTPHSETPKDSTTEGGEDSSGTQLYHRAKFHADRCHRRRYICSQTKNTTDTADDNYIQQNAY